MWRSKYHPVKALANGDAIGVFSPSEPLTADRVNRSKESISELETRFRLKWATNALAEQYYQAGTREQRLADVEELLADDGISAVIASWGGKNCNQLVGGLPYSEFSRRKIPVIGFSDTAVLLNAISVECSIPTFYGPNILGKLTESQHQDLDLITGHDVPPFGNSYQDSWKTIRGGAATGRLYGGNLSTFVLGLAGSSVMEKMDDVCFFWESGSEPPQIIDQHLTCLENCGFFSRVTSMIVGLALYEEAERKDRPLDELLEEYAHRHRIPVARFDNFGHQSTENPCIPIGARVALSTDKREIRLIDRVVF